MALAVTSRETTALRYMDRIKIYETTATVYVPLSAGMTAGLTQ